MNQILDGLIRAFQLIFSGDPRVLEVTVRSLYVSGSATLIATLWGIPIAMILALKKSPIRFFVKSIFNTLLGVPTVGLGLILFLLLSKSGPFGFLSLLYNPTGMIVGEAVLVTPIIVSLTTIAIEAVDPEIMNQAKTLGATQSQASLTMLREASSGIFLAGISSFNRAIAELGIAQMVGGNIRDRTEVLTTAIANEINFDISLSIALAVILLTLVFAVTLTANVIQRRRK